MSSPRPTVEAQRACVRCGEPTEFVWCWDSRSTGHAHNVYACDGCGAVSMVRVWDDRGVVTVDASGAITLDTGEAVTIGP